MACNLPDWYTSLISVMPYGVRVEGSGGTVRFEVSRVMDAIEQRLTTDVTLAQAVVDLADVARFVGLDGGRPINLLRVGMVVDALGRYLIDAGAMLYPVAGRELLSEAALTSKERMVL